MKIIKKYMRLAVVLSIMLIMLCHTCTAARQANNAAPDTQPPAAPQGLNAANITHTTILLNWTASSDNIKVNGYQVYRDGKKIITISKTAYTNVDLVPGRKYTYAIKAYDAAGNVSGYSNLINVATTGDMQSPSAPGALTASSAGFTSVALNWEPSIDNTSIKGYELYCNGKKTASTTATYYTNKGLLPGNTYTFFVKAYDIAGNYSVQSNSISVATASDRTAPSIPIGLKASSVTAMEVNLTWSPSSDNVKVKGYEIFRDGTKISTSTKTSYCSKNLIPGKSHKYSVKAYDTSGNLSDISSILQITTLKDTQAPTAPTGLKASSVNGSSVYLTWNASTDNVKIKGYQIFRNGVNIASSTRAYHTVKCPAGLGIYLFYVKAYDLNENISGISNTVTVIIP